MYRGDRAWGELTARVRVLGVVAAAAVATTGIPGAGTAADLAAYVSNTKDGTVSVIDIATNTVTATITIPGVSALSEGVAVNPDDTEAYVTSGKAFTDEESDVLVVIDAATNTVAAIVPLISASNVAVTPDSSRLYVTQPALNTVAVVSTATRSVIATITVDEYPFGIAVTPDGSRVYVANLSANTVSVITTATNSVMTTIPVGKTVDAVAISPDGAAVYVTNENTNTVSIISTATNTITGTISVGHFPVGLAISPDGARVYVANESAGTVSVIDTGTQAVTATIAVGNAPYGVAFTPDGTAVYVPNRLDDTVSVLATASNSMTATIPVGKAPRALGIFIAPGAPLPTPTPSDGCGPVPRSGCAQPENAAVFSVHTTARRMRWKWLGGSTPVDLSHIGNPVNGPTAYDLCVYDTSAGPPSLVSAANIPAGGTCGAAPCWKRRGNRFSYANAAGTPDGVKRMALQASGRTGGSIVVKGQGSHLHLPVSGDGIFLLREFPDVIVQVQRQDRPQCWEAIFTSPAMYNNRTVFVDSIR